MIDRPPPPEIRDWLRLCLCYCIVASACWADLGVNVIDVIDGAHIAAWLLPLLFTTAVFNSVMAVRQYRKLLTMLNF